MHYDGAIMMARTQISLDPELQSKARHRASQLGVSFATYVRTLVERDLTHPRRSSDVSAVFNLGDSGGSDVASEKDLLVGQAVARRPEVRAGRRRRRAARRA